MAELVAPATWRTIDFISDLHLQATEPAIFEVWRSYMAQTSADAVVMLGDVFEVWVGDDAATRPGFEADCAQVMADTAARLPLYFMHGNRDFLVGPALMARCHTTLLDDPTVLTLGTQRWLLTHGDALCLDDHAYMAFRAEVRSPAWQASFLAKPLAERQTIARSLRDASEQRKRGGATYADVDTTAARAWLHAARAHHLLHGHTHHPADHDLGDGFRRVVLSDWDASATPSRQQVLRLSATGWQRQDLC